MAKYLWGAAIFLLPFTISTVLWQTTIFEQGSYNAYTGFSLYLSELALFAALAVWIIEKAIKNKRWGIDRHILIVGGVALGLALISVAVSQDYISSLLGIIHILAALIALFFTRQKVLPSKTLIKIFVGTLAIQAIIGIMQFITQGSLGLSLIGESLIGADIAGVAKLDLGGATIVRAYGTFPHANVMAGFLFVGIFLAKELKGHFWKVAQILIWIAFFLAFSKGAILALIIALFINKKAKKRTLISVLFVIGALAIIAHESTTERFEYLKMSLYMIASEPIGVGLDQFTARMQEFTSSKLQPWQYQPVHNIYLLLANELGFWTLLIFLKGVQKLINSAKKHHRPIIWGLLIIGLFDHYLISLYQGLILSSITFGYVWSYSKLAPTKSS